MAEDSRGGCKRAHVEFELEGGIISEIMARLPAKSVMRFRCVSKSWNDLISDPYFTKKHFKYAEMGINDNTSRLLYTLDPPQSLDLKLFKHWKDDGDAHSANRVLDLPE